MISDLELAEHLFPPHPLFHSFSSLSAGYLVPEFVGDYRITLFWHLPTSGILSGVHLCQVASDVVKDGRRRCHLGVVALSAPITHCHPESDPPSLLPCLSLTLRIPSGCRMDAEPVVMLFYACGVEWNCHLETAKKKKEFEKERERERRRDRLWT